MARPAIGHGRCPVPSGVLPCAPVHALGCVVLAVAEPAPQPQHIDIMIPPGVFVLALILLGIALGVARHVPHPDSSRSWVAGGNEVLVTATELTVLPGLLLFFLILAAVLHVLRRVGIRAQSGHLPGWLPLWRFVMGRLSAALSLHRAVATRKGHLSSATGEALYRVHRGLARCSWELRDELVLREVRRTGEGSDAVRRIRDTMGQVTTSHARLALRYGGLIGLRCRRPLPTAEMHLLCAVGALAAGIDPTRQDATLMRETGLAALADAVQARWVSPGERRLKAIVLKGHIRRLRLIGQQPAFEQDERLPLLVGMLEAGATSLYSGHSLEQGMA